MEAHGVGAQDEHFIPTPNRWTNQKSELGYSTIPKDLCGDESTRLGDHFELAELCYNSEHLITGATPFQMVMGKSPIVLIILARHG